MKSIFKLCRFLGGGELLPWSQAVEGPDKNRQPCQGIYGCTALDEIAAEIQGMAEGTLAKSEEEQFPQRHGGEVGLPLAELGTFCEVGFVDQMEHDEVLVALAKQIILGPCAYTLIAGGSNLVIVEQLEHIDLMMFAIKKIETF